MSMQRASRYPITSAHQQEELMPEGQWMDYETFDEVSLAVLRRAYVLLLLVAGIN